MVATCKTPNRQIPKGSYLPPARFWSLVEAIVAAVLIFLPVTANQVAAILAVVAVATGEQVVRKVRPA